MPTEHQPDPVIIENPNENEKLKTVQEAIHAITSIQMTREEVPIQVKQIQSIYLQVVMVEDKQEKIKVNSILMGLSTLATFAILNLLFQFESFVQIKLVFAHFFNIHFHYLMKLNNIAMSGIQSGRE